MATRQPKVKGLVNDCPYGCTDDQLDENGYCRHLVGWTNDGKVMERRAKGSPKERIDKKRHKIVHREPSSRVYEDVPAEVADQAETAAE